MGAAESTQAHINPEIEEFPSILIVDEHFVTAEIERNYLASVGFQVFLATSLAAVEDIVTTESIDLIMIDLGFARKQGLRVMQNAKKMSKNRDMKSIVTSVEALPALRKNAEQNGADAFLVKPAPRPKVLKEIKKLTSQKSRDTERIKQKLELQMKFGETQMAVLTLDLSSDGVHLGLKDKSLAHLTPKVGTSITLSLFLEKSARAMNLTGTVVRHTNDGFGVRFDELGMSVRRELDKFILRHSLELKASQFYL